MIHRKQSHSRLDYPYRQKQFAFMSSNPDALLFCEAQAGSKQALDTLLARHQGLIYHVIGQYHFPVSEEVKQAGTIGLWTAIKKYDPDMGTRFSTYAQYWIASKIQRELDAEKFFHKPQTKVYRERAKACSLDAVEDYIGNLPDRHTGANPEALEAMEQADYLLNKAHIKERDREVIRLWSHGKTLKQIGDSFHMTRERARQILDRSLEAVRKVSTRQATV